MLYFFYLSKIVSKANVLIGWMNRTKQMDEACYVNLELLARLHSFFGRKFHLSTLLNGLKGWVVVTGLLRGPL